MDGLTKALELMGGTVALAKAVGVSKQMVTNWKARGTVPVEHCPTVERVTGRQVRCEDLNSSVDWGYLRHPYPVPEPAKEPAAA